MAPELSSNWKKLQEKLKAPQPTKSAPISQEAAFKQAISKKSISSETLKRKAEESQQQQQQISKKPKRQKFQTQSQPSQKPTEEKMGGNVQSKPTTSSSPNTTLPSLHLWADEQGISSESLAEAYNLGLRSTSSSSSHIPLLSTLPPAIPNAGLTLPGQSSSSSSSSSSSTSSTPSNKNGLPLPTDLPSSLTLSNGLTLDTSTTTDLALILQATKSNTLGKYLSIDCEMVGTGPSGVTSVLARCSIVDFHGHQIYDSYVRPTAFVTDWRTHVSGISKRHMASARSFESVQATVAALLKGRILVGHDVKHDLEVLGFEHPHRDIRDTAKYSGFRKYGHGPKPSLRVLAKEVLGIEIHQGQHSSVEDARVAMLLFRKEKHGFDMENSNRYEEGQAKKGGNGGGGGGKKKKGKK